VPFFHFMDEDHRYGWKSFLNVEEAVAECKRIVDADLQGYLKPDITAAELYDMYTSFGDDPFIVGVDPNAQSEHFSAWDYALRLRLRLRQRWKRTSGTQTFCNAAISGPEVTLRVINCRAARPRARLLCAR
jgi:hypothetical protein